jgi:hypothetical protein
MHYAKMGYRYYGEKMNLFQLHTDYLPFRSFKYKFHLDKTQDFFLTTAITSHFIWRSK